MRPVRHPRRALAAATLAVAVVVFGMAACGDDADISSVPTTVTAQPGTSQVPTSQPDDAGCPPPVTRNTGARQADPEGVPVYLRAVDVSVEVAGCTERVTFAFEDPAPGDRPGWQIGYDKPPFEGADGRGVAVAGDAHLRVVLHAASGVDLSGDEVRETYRGPREITPDATSFVDEVQFVSDFEAVMDWVIGLDMERPFVVAWVGSELRIEFASGARS